MSLSVVILFIHVKPPFLGLILPVHDGCLLKGAPKEAGWCAETDEEVAADSGASVVEALDFGLAWRDSGEFT